MEMTGSQIAIKTASVLIPLAISAGKSCFGGVRAPDKVRKHCLCIPTRGGKGFLANALSGQKQYLVIDVDEQIQILCKRPQLEALESAKRSGSSLAVDIAYKQCADVVLAEVKGLQKTTKTLKVLFLTSSYMWACARKHLDGVMMAAPESSFFEEIVEAHKKKLKADNHTDAELLVEVERIRRARKDFLESLPVGAEVAIYGSYDELLSMVRDRLAIVKTL